MIRRFTGAGILIQATTSVGFSVNRTTMFSNGTGSTGAGIRVVPGSGGSATGTINKAVADRNVFGIAADGSNGNVNVAIEDSVASNNTLSGIVATAGAGTTNVVIMRTQANNNATGVNNSGGRTTVRVGQSAISGNTTGVSGTVTSYSLNGNGSDGTMTAIPLK